jgi:hypothetical protein
MNLLALDLRHGTSADSKRLRPLTGNGQAAEFLVETATDVKVETVKSPPEGNGVAFRPHWRVLAQQHIPMTATFVPFTDDKLRRRLVLGGKLVPPSRAASFPVGTRKAPSLDSVPVATTEVLVVHSVN